MEIQLAFYKGNDTVIDVAIQNWSKSKYSHVEIVIDNTFYSSSPRDGGVRKKNINVNHDNWDFLTIQISDELYIHAMNVFNEAEGMDYDWIGILFSQIMYIPIHHLYKYFCSELCAEMLDICDPYLYHPGMLYEYLLKKINRNDENEVRLFNVRC